MKRSKEQILKDYITMINFLADFLGSDYEIVLHDVDDVEQSIIYIRNNFSGRNIGGSITDLGLRVLKEKHHLSDEYYVNYHSKTLDGKMIRSATYFISDDDNQLIAMLCINTDVTRAQFALDYLGKIVEGEKHTVIKAKEEESKKKISETLFDSVEGLAHQMISDATSKYSVPVARMSLDERKDIISMLDKKGFFLIKGTVRTVANRLDVSETTVYRCINSY